MFRRSSTFGLFALLATGPVARTARQSGRHSCRCWDGRAGVVPLDAAYHGGPLLVAGTTITTRLPANAALHILAPPRAGRRGRLAKKGQRLPRLTELAAAATWRTVAVHRYGRVDTMAVAAIECLWYGPFGDTLGQAVLVREPDTDTGYDLALFTTDRDSHTEHIIERYADW